MTRSWTMRAVVVLVAIPSAAGAQRFTELAIKGGDYAYVTPPATLGGGLTLFSLENVGKQLHEMIIARLKPGINADSAARTLAAGDLRGAQQVLEAPEGILIAPPGIKSTGRLLIDLQSGQRYVMLCNFRDTPDKPRHTALGMYASFTVK